MLKVRGDKKTLQLQTRWDMETGKMSGQEQRQLTEGKTLSQNSKAQRDFRDN